MKKRLLSTLLALCMALALVPTGAYAIESSVIHVTTPDEFRAALAEVEKRQLEEKDLSPVTIELTEGDYFFDNDIFARELTIGALEITNLTNLTIKGTGTTRILCNNSDNEIFWIDNCTNLTLIGLDIGYELLEESYGSRAIAIWDDSTVSIIDCDIFGCLLDGIEVAGSDIDMKNSTIHDCYNKIMYIAGNAAFENCVFWGNGHEDEEYYRLTNGIELRCGRDEDRSVIFTDCTFKDNHQPASINIYGNPDLDTDADIFYSFDNCIFSQNAWSGIDIPVTFSPGYQGSGTMPEVILTATEDGTAQYKLPECSLTAPAGYEFDKWEVNWKSYAPGEVITVSGEATVKAIWRKASATTCTVTFVDQQTGKQIKTSQVQRGAALGTLPIAPTHPGYTFQGWYDASGKAVTTSTKVTGNMTVYARYEKTATGPSGPSEPSGSAFTFEFKFGGLDPQTGDLKMSIVVYMNGIELLTIPLTLHLG